MLIRESAEAENGVRAMRDSFGRSCSVSLGGGFRKGLGDWARRRPWRGIALAGASVCMAGWINYTDHVKRKPAEFGKEFVGVSLKLETKRVEFEVTDPEPVRVVLRNKTSRKALLPGLKVPFRGGRFVRFYLILASEGGASYFSPDLFHGRTGAPADGALPARGESVIFESPFSKLRWAHIEEFQYGLPCIVPGKTRFFNSAELAPQVYTMKAVLVSGLPKRRPDFVVASKPWPLLLRPTSGNRMTEAEKQARLRRYLRKMAQGAYGGIGVSSQLAALGDIAVAPLIRMAEKPGGGKTFESRVWAIVTLCNIKSPKASAYILEKLKNPVALDYVNFLAWHSLACHDPAIEKELDLLVRDIVFHRSLPWQKKFGVIPQGVLSGFLEYTFKHFSMTRHWLSDDTAAALLKWPNPKPVSFGLAVWKPGSPEAAVRVLGPLFLRPWVHPNLKKAALARLSQALAAQGFPAYEHGGDVDAAWHRAGLWLVRNWKISRQQERTFLRMEVLSVRNPEVRKEIIAELRRVVGPEFPVATAAPRLPEDWVATWRWALHAGPIPAKTAVAFLCRQMRTKEEIPDGTKRALLIELRHFIGARFPLANPNKIDLDAAWPRCGNWLIAHGYFGKPRGSGRRTHHRR